VKNVVFCNILHQFGHVIQFEGISVGILNTICSEIETASAVLT
jgi:hypothetical protein